MFSFLANSAREDDRSGIATWTYTISERNGKKEVVFNLPLNSFIEAEGINKMLKASYESGYEAGKAKIIGAVEEALKDR
jgi:hypothetical protein